MTAFVLDGVTQSVRRTASDPRGSAWVSANAGSGKTTVLTERVVRLLLAGAHPGRILCLTFTKAAAAEMASRVFARLSEWVRLDDAALAASLTELEGHPPRPEHLTLARRLFARALETPGGLKIQTIHAFCERLLHQFPLEAGVPAHFEVLAELDADRLIREARRAALIRAAHSPDGTLGLALRTLVALTKDVNTFDALSELIEKRDAFLAWLADAGSLDAALAGLRRGLGLRATDDRHTVRARIVGEAALSQGDLLDLRQRLGPATQANAASRLEKLFAAETEDQRVAAYSELFLTKDGKPRAPNRNDIPAYAPHAAGEAQRIVALNDLARAAECFEGSAALITLAHAVIDAYERDKRARGRLDFDDLVIRTAALLHRRGGARWVQYKLDQGLDHVLVDEAQDTSPRQWQVIEGLVDDFFSGRAARDNPRTLFAVGDEKQSIFSFQGAVPAWFGRMQRVFGERVRDAERPFADVELHLSFRSTEDVLAAVDSVFADPTAHQGLASEAKPTDHVAARHAAPGLVTIWPMLVKKDRKPPEDWAAPLDQLPEDSPEKLLADRLARTIRGWIDNGERLEATGEPITPGDILILIRNRGRLSEAINRTLKEAGVPVAGVDRIALVQHIAVLDLLALAEVMLLPEDDLSLAAILKSPLIGLDEDALLRLANARPGTLWRALEGRAAGEPAFAEALARLRAWRGAADFTGPFDFYARILGAEGGRAAFARRLGPEAEDVLDEFLAQAIAYERSETPSLQGFVAWLRAAATEIKREPAEKRDEVRVMTVHGAKGLEAEVVFLVDGGGKPVHQNHDPALLLLSDDVTDPKPSPIVWMRSKRSTPPSVVARLETERRRAAEEYRRLLYVGLTRAKDRLYVCGIETRDTDATEGWHALVSNALLASATALTGADGSVEAWEWRKPGSPRAAKIVPIAPPPAAAPPVEAPRFGPLPRAPAPKRLSPSLALAELSPAVAAALGEGTGFAVERGRLIHRLLQALPDIAPAARRPTALRFLAAAAPGWPVADRAAAAAEIADILADPRHAALFAPGSRAEVAISAIFDVPAGPLTVTGRIDRLAVTADTVHIVDYKTNRHPPQRLAEIPAEYAAQLALYRAVLARLYPGRTVVASLIWTEGPRVMEVPSAMLDEAFQRLTAG